MCSGKDFKIASFTVGFSSNLDKRHFCTITSLSSTHATTLVFLPTLNAITTSLSQLSNQNSLHMHSCYSYGSTYIPFKLNRLTPRTGPVRAALSSPEKRTRKKKQVKDDDTLLENSLRFSFMEELMNRSRNRDSTGVSQVMYDMIAAGLSPGPRSFHGLVVSYALNGNEQAAVMFQLTCFQLIYRSKYL